MRSFRTSLVVATTALALSWSGLSRAEDDVSSKKGTTKSQTGDTTKSGTSGASGASGTGGTTGTSGTTDTMGTDTTGSSTDTTDTQGMSPSTQPSTTPSTSTDTSAGTGSDQSYGTGYGSTYTTTPGSPPSTQPYSPYQQTQVQPPPATTYSTTTTTAATYDDSASADRAGYEYRPNRPMLFTGLGIFAGTYATSAIVAAQSDRDEDKRLYIPVVGPWLDLGQRECGPGGCDQTEDWNRALLIGSGVLQGVGAGLSIASLFVPEERDRPMRARSAAATSTASAKPTVRVLPVSVRGGGGFGAFGTF